jgi:hypothetical protein
MDRSKAILTARKFAHLGPRRKKIKKKITSTCIFPFKLKIDRLTTGATIYGKGVGTKGANKKKRKKLEKEEAERKRRKLEEEQVKRVEVKKIAGGQKKWDLEPGKLGEANKLTQLGIGGGQLGQEKELINLIENVEYEQPLERYFFRNISDRSNP